MKLIANIDGGSRGNPGPAGAGISVRDESGRPVLEAGYFLGRMTNNMAEYTALLRALETCKSRGATSLLVYCDSELLVKQINGEYRVRNETLKDYFDQAMAALRAIGDWKIQHVRREGNERADELANLAMDAGEDVIEVDRRGDPVQDYSV